MAAPARCHVVIVTGVLMQSRIVFFCCDISMFMAYFRLFLSGVVSGPVLECRL